MSEGYATASSAFEASGNTTIMGINAGNLMSVVEAVMSRYPQCHLILAADNDVKDGSLSNPGKDSAMQIAQRFGCQVVLPKFPSDKERDPTTGNRYKDFNDLQLVCGVDEVRRQLKDNLAAPLKLILKPQETNGWPKPRPLPAGLSPVSPLLPRMIPKKLRRWAEDVADRMQVPLDFVVVPAIVVLSSLLGRQLGIHPKKHDDWLVVPNLWGGIIGRPSKLKSSAIQASIVMLEELVKEAIESHEQEEREHEFNQSVFESKKKAILDSIKKSSSNAQQLDDLKNKYQELVPPNPPKPKRYCTQDATIQKLGELLHDNPNGLLIYRDELVGWLRSIDKDGSEGNRQFFLESWNGSGSFTVDRIGRGTIYIPSLCLSILGGIQPSLLESYVMDCLEGGIGDDGLLQRFQLLVWPDQINSWTNIDRPPDQEAAKAAKEVFQEIANLNLPFNQSDTASEIPTVRFTPSAQSTFDAWRTDLETRLPKLENPSLESHLAKYRSLMPALALIFEVIERGAKIVKVEDEAIEQAICWCNYLETHARRIYGIAEAQHVISAKTLLKKLEQGELKSIFTERDVYRHHWSSLTTREYVRDAVEFLEDLGWVRIVETQTGGRPKREIWAHPSIGKNPKPEDP